MESLKSVALRISPQFTANDWHALQQDSEVDWERAVRIVRDRLDGRFFAFASQCLLSPHSGFVVLSIDALLLETLQQFREGIIDGRDKSKEMITKFLAGPRFQPAFNQKACKAFYQDIRCGLLHQAEAKNMWLIRRGRSSLLEIQPGGNGYIIDVKRFHDALRESMNDYFHELCQPESKELRDNLWKKMNHICNVRIERGVVFEDE